jgi:GH18 family chitinase
LPFKDNLQKFTALKSRTLKVMASVGGWMAGSQQFSYAAADPTLREEFVTSVLYFCLEYRFDGFDLDWGKCCVSIYHLECNL